MTKETENLLKKYWQEGYRILLLSKDNKLFITRDINGWSYTSEELLNKSAQEVAYLPSEELKDLFSEENRSADISELINVIDWNSIEVDTPVIIRRRGTHIVLRRYFKEFITINNRVGVFSRGCTSWSNDCGYADYYDIDEVTLAEVENE